MTEPSSSDHESASDTTSPHAQPVQHTTAPLHPHSANFDLGLARFSLGLEVVCFTFIAFAPTALTFTIFGMIASWGGGFNPAVQALALELYARRHVKREEAETGKLFGALSVIQAMWYVFLATGSSSLDLIKVRLEQLSDPRSLPLWAYVYEDGRSGAEDDIFRFHRMRYDLSLLPEPRSSSTKHATPLS